MPKSESRRGRVAAWAALGVACVISIVVIARWAGPEVTSGAPAESEPAPSPGPTASDPGHPAGDQPPRPKPALERRDPGAALRGPPQSSGDAGVGSSEAQAARRVDALVNSGDIGAARSAAEKYFREHPNGPQTGRLSRLTGARPMPSAPP